MSFDKEGLADVLGEITNQADNLSTLSEGTRNKELKEKLNKSITEMYDIVENLIEYASEE